MLNIGKKKWFIIIPLRFQASQEIFQSFGFLFKFIGFSFLSANEGETFHDDMFMNIPHHIHYIFLFVIQTWSPLPSFVTCFWKDYFQSTENSREMFLSFTLLAKRNTFFVGFEFIIIGVFDEKKRHFLIHLFRKHDEQLKQTFYLLGIDAKRYYEKYFHRIYFRLIQKLRKFIARFRFRILLDKRRIKHAYLFPVQFFVIRFLK